MHILIVDDEELNRSLLEELLKDEYTLTIVGDGQSCLNSINDKIPDILLLDISLPDINGIDICAKIKADPNLKKIRVLLLSAYAGPKDIAAGLEAGADIYFKKPFDVEKLQEAIKTLS